MHKISKIFFTFVIVKKGLIIMTAIVAVIISSALSSCSSKRTVSRQSAVQNTQQYAQQGSTHPVVEEALGWLGTPYRYGGHDKSGTDCSGMVLEVFLSRTGIALPRSSAEQYRYCRHINRRQARAGDLVFFRSARSGGKVTHVGIYMGDGQFVHASSSHGVIVSDLSQNYYVKYYEGFGRVPGMQ